MLVLESLIGMVNIISKKTPATTGVFFDIIVNL
ncbi:hypothetical protein QE441_002634 [Chryseobacterium sp. SORGH_AS909]|uniref:Uncharacterized protein n=1 Tax=Chryseobacterium camelliae TaxID=1265445 RepID=A0ABU0TF14_9FLAO|nr:hypothetical protein [Chryseobacterium camelliae]MDQ1099493.1 hypothetical protein [Chryseobacterium sp. SORGH_AS_1048]MDR6086840.1 hypothetical protein [Chryseobacterium sp. SORGH_AS_0909]MDR6131211.1 hypothetical protein [Chryseobacterium sp. SORGH_AS_1175]MDT3406647.1 hypothetical protein [Pseudacidovorax intermedius]